MIRYKYFNYKTAKSASVAHDADYYIPFFINYEIIFHTVIIFKLEFYSILLFEI